ncbi:MAG: hypothetical protein GWP91_23855 [Rhodobacterales bacterium]|nr:hypothetical protein [Rhodobacterales bacterium]
MFLATIRVGGLPDAGGLTGGSSGGPPAVGGIRVTLPAVVASEHEADVAMRFILHGTSSGAVLVMVEALRRLKPILEGITASSVR